MWREVESLANSDVEMETARASCSQLERHEKVGGRISFEDKRAKQAEEKLM